MSEHKQFSRAAEPMVFTCTWDTRENVTPGSSFGPVLREVYTFECNVSGYGTITIDGKTFEVAPGDFYFLLPGQTITYTADRKDPRLALWCTAGGLRLGQMLLPLPILLMLKTCKVWHFVQLFSNLFLVHFKANMCKEYKFILQTSMLHVSQKYSFT